MNSQLTPNTNNTNPLSALSLTELWELFPLALVEPQGDWANQYRTMQSLLEQLLHDVSNVRINHIGSTTLGTIKTKDIVDVLVEVDGAESLEEIALLLEHHGFIRMSTEPARISLNYGYTPQGYADEVYHIHLRYRGDNDELYFRDYLKDHPDIAREYEALKLELCEQCFPDRDAYTDGKTAFMQKWTQAAKSLYGNRY